MHGQLTPEIRRQLEAMVSEMTQVLEVLKRDLDFSLAIHKKDPANQIIRRMAIRNFCAFAEATTNTLKSLSLHYHAALAAGLAAEEIDALMEQTSVVDSGGNAKSRPMHISFPDNFKFACNIYSRIFHCSYVPGFRDAAWSKVLATFKVRDRLMHPKVHQSVEVQDGEIATLQDALAWLGEVTVSLQGSWNIAQIGQRIRGSSADKLN